MLTLKPDSYSWALEHALLEGDTDVLPVPFEYLALKHDWTEALKHLQSADVTQWTTRPHRRVLTPKARYGFRVITQLDPLDFLTFTALVYEMGADLERRRVPTTDQRVFSYRFKPQNSGRMFDPAVGFAGFQARTRTVLEDASVTHVAVADIADFYPRIYFHRLENALGAATSRSNHVAATVGLLKQWNTSETFGIPVGGAACRLLAEVTIANVDELLLAERVNFVRFNDDFRIFAGSQREAYKSLVMLAESLYHMHGLTLQPQKTAVLTREQFSERYQIDPEDRELASLSEKFEQLIEMLGLENPYEPIRYEDLDDEQRALVDSMNLAELFEEAVGAETEIDVPFLRFLLRRLGQLGNDAAIDTALDNVERLHPVFPDIVGYVTALNLEPERKVVVGGKLIGLLRESIVGDLPYYQVWAVQAFAGDSGWNHVQEFAELLKDTREDCVRRKLILAMGRAGQTPWFQKHWRALADWAPWPRRAFLAAASCLPVDARRHWYRSVEPQLDPLEKAVVAWAKVNPFA
jgi:hypothetical protein